MIYATPALDDPIDQGDLIDDCPVMELRSYRPGQQPPLDIGYAFYRIVVLTQTCDLANEKVTSVTVAEIRDAQRMVDDELLKPADIKGPLRSGRIWGLYFLPADAALGLGEMVVDLRRLHTVKLDLLRTLIRVGKQRGRIRPLYREHLAKHFGDTFSRIGLPRPYDTL